MKNEIERTSVNKIFIRNAVSGYWDEQKIKQIVIHLFGFCNITIEEDYMQNCYCFVYGNNFTDAEVMKMTIAVDKKIRELNQLRKDLELVGITIDEK